MRMMEKLEEDCYYHIYNRGIDGGNIFKAPKDYGRFIAGFRDYTKDVLDVLSYCLLGNHFHSLIYTKRGVTVPRNDGQGTIKLVASRQLGHFFNSYAQAFNKDYDRTGSLFDKPFKRKLIELNDYLKTVVLYIHTNPRHHGITEDFQTWKYSS